MWNLFFKLTFSLVPLAPVESALSLPARSTRLILLTYNRIRNNRMKRRTKREWNGGVYKLIHNTRQCRWPKFWSWKSHHCQSYLQRPSGSNKAKITLHAEATKVGSKTERQGRWIENLFAGVVCVRVVFLLGEDDVEDSMRAATRLIHVGRSHGPTKNTPKHNHQLHLWCI